MSDLFLDLRDKPAVVDFLVDASEFAAPKDREAADVFIKTYQDGEKLSTDKLAEAARHLAVATWPQRYALERYLAEEGAGDEWQKLLAALRPSTAHVLKRFRDVAKVGPVDEALRHAESDVALREEERSEIDHVREQVHHDLWHEKQGAMSVLRQEGVAELEQYMKRFKILRDAASEMSPSMLDEVFSKIRHYEDRILFEGERVPLEILDREIAYYTDQKEINPLETEGKTTGRRKRPPEI